MEEVLHVVVTKSMDIHDLSKLVASAAIVFVSFDLWMSGGGIHMFAMVINYLSEN